MAWYRIYAGTDHINDYGVYEFDNEGQASQAAYDLAVEDYFNHEGINGFPSYDDCWQDAIDELSDNTAEPDEDEINELAQSYYEEALENHIQWYVVEQKPE